MFSGSGLFWLLPFLLLTINAKEKPMAEKKVVGRLVNTVSFQTDRASLQKALADIKKVKDAMKGLVVPANAMRKQTAAMKQQTQGLRQQTKAKSDYYIVQKAIDKREKAQLATQEKYSRAKQKQAQAEKSIASARIRQAVGNLTSDGSGQKASQSLFANMMRNEARMGKIHSRALAENAKRDRVAAQNAARVSARRMDTVRSDRFGLTSRFGAGAGRKFDSIANQFSSGAISARMYRQQVSALRRDLSAAANAQRGFNGTLKDMRSAFVQATASYTAFAGISGAANIGKQYEARQAGMLVGTGDPEKARKQIAFLDKEIYRLGLDQQVASQGFVQMSVAAKGILSEGDLQNLFKGLGELSTAVQLDPFRFEKTILAISQVMNKTQLMSEEIKSQLGEQLPGSLEAVRRATEKFMKKDVSTKELMELMKNGKLLAKDILPLLGKEFADMARQGGALRYALNSLNSVQGRLNKSFKDWVSSIYQGGLLDGLRDLYKTLDQLFYYMAQGGDSAIGQFLKGFLGQLENSIVFIYNNMLDLYYMLKYDFGVSGADMELLGKVAYWAAIVGALNSTFKLMTMIFGGGMLGMITKTTAAISGFGAATTATAGSAGAFGLLGTQLTALTSAIGSILAPLTVIAAAIGGTYWAQQKYNDLSPKGKLDYQLKTTTASNTLNNDYYGGKFALGQQGNLPNTNPYLQMMVAAVQTDYAIRLAELERKMKEEAPPLRLDVAVKDTEFAKAIDVRFAEGFGKVMGTILPASAPSAPSLLVR